MQTMRKIVLVILLIIAFAFSTENSTAQESTTAAELAQDTSYQLPYPGILPDSSFYPLKVFRDRIVEFLIADALKKSEFYLLEADKHLNSGIFLFKKGKISLAETTISKGENYLEKSFSKIEEAKNLKLDTASIERKFNTSVRVHRAYLAILKKDSQKEFKGKFAALEIRVAKFGEKVETQVK